MFQVRGPESVDVDTDSWEEDGGKTKTEEGITEGQLRRGVIREQRSLLALLFDDEYNFFN